MKIAVYGILLMLLGTSASAQILRPVKWSFTAKKRTSQVYEIHMVAKMDAGWHVYAQVQPKTAVALPTAFSFKPLKGVTYLGKPSEQGKMTTEKVGGTNIVQNYYGGLVTFIQAVKISPGAKPIISGTVEFMACRENRCLPSDTREFSIRLE